MYSPPSSTTSNLWLILFHLYLYHNTQVILFLLPLRYFEVRPLTKPQHASLRGKDTSSESKYLFTLKNITNFFLSPNIQIPLFHNYV